MSDPPFFVPDGERFVATASTRGPWSPDHQHGGPPAALCVRALEALAGAGMLLTRLTVDFLRPVPIAALTVKTETVRAGRKVQRLRAMLLDARGEELLHVSAVALRTASGAPTALRDAEPAPSAPEASAPFIFPFFTDAVGYHTAMEGRIGRGRWGHGAVAAWLRMRVPLVAGETPSPAQRVLVAADSASGVAVVLDHARSSWINADLTVSLHRAPEGEWIGLDAVTTAEPDGIGMTRARLWDTRGPVGISLQSLVIESRAPADTSRSL